MIHVFFLKKIRCGEEMFGGDNEGVIYEERLGYLNKIC